jgi:hypothetical protein
MKRTLVAAALALGLAACQTNLPVDEPQFATATDKLPEPVFGLVVLNPATAARNQAFCEQYRQIPPPPSLPIHTFWLVTSPIYLPIDCPQMLERYDFARTADTIEKSQFLGPRPTGEGPYLVLVGADQAVLADASGRDDFGPFLTGWTATVEATEAKLAGTRPEQSVASTAAKVILGIFLILLLSMGHPGGA